MFYSQVILAKKGPLAKVWLAAHWGDKKLARPQIFATDISQSCVDIMNPSVPLALRLSGHLLLGVVRIYSRKVKYVLNDCTEAMLKLQMAFSKQGAQLAQLDGSGTIKGVGGRELLSDKDAPTHQLVSNFGEYDQVHVVEGFCLPLPEDNEWILAEDDEEMNGANGGGGLLLTAHLPTGGNTQQKSRGVSPEQVLPQEETWAAFDPDGEEEEEEDEDENTNAKTKTNADKNANKNDEERSQVSDIEVVRAANNDSMMSDDQLGRSTSLIGDKSALSEEGAVLTTPGGVGSGAAGRPSGDVFNPEDDDNFNIPFEEDSEDEQGGGGGGDFTDGVGVGGPPNLDLSREGTGTPGGPPNLDLSRESAETPLGGGTSVANLSVSGLALDDDSATQGSTNNKRSLDEDGKKPRRRRRKRRKVVIDNNETELTNDHIRGMISDTSDIVRVMIHPATIWDTEGLGRDYQTLVKDRLALEGVTIHTTNGNGITGSSSSGNNKKNSKKNMEDLVIPSLTRPFLVDEGSMGGPQLHPDLAKLWQDNYWKALDQPCPYKRDVEEEEEEEEEEEQQQQPVEDVELARRGSGTNADDESDAGTHLSSDLNVEKEQEQQPEQEGGTAGPPLIDEEENNFPVEEEEEEEEEEPAEFPAPDFGDEENNLTLTRSPDEDDMLELGMVNEFILDSEEEEDDEDEEDIANRQALGDVASSTTKWHKHTVRVYQHLKKSMKDPNSTEDNAADDDSDASPKQDLPEHIMFKQLTKNVVSRRNAASVFFEMLQLKTWDFIDLNQEDPYGDITISPGVRFSEDAPAN